MNPDDPLGDLLFLARAGADAGEDWRNRLRHEWAPAAVRSHREALRHGLIERGVGDEDLDDLTEAVVRIVEQDLEEAGID